MARPGVEGGAESVPIHQADLGVDGLVPEQVLLRRDHVLQNLETQEKGLMRERA